MFCSKCAKEIDDSAVVCINCGCPTSNYNKSQQTNYQQPVYNSAQNNPMLISRVREYTSKANTIYTLSIIGVILSLGIGFIFAIIAGVKMNNMPIISENIDDASLRVELDTAQRKIESSKKLIVITWIILVISFVLSFIIGFLSAL